MSGWMDRWVSPFKPFIFLSTLALWLMEQKMLTIKKLSCSFVIHVSCCSFLLLSYFLVWMQSSTKLCPVRVLRIAQLKTFYLYVPSEVLLMLVYNTCENTAKCFWENRWLLYFTALLATHLASSIQHCNSVTLLQTHKCARCLKRSADCWLDCSMALSLWSHFRSMPL